MERIFKKSYFEDRNTRKPLKQEKLYLTSLECLGKQS